MFIVPRNDDTLFRGGIAYDKDMILETVSYIASAMGIKAKSSLAQVGVVCFRPDKLKTLRMGFVFWNAVIQLIARSINQDLGFKICQRA